jgi:hypothetical protein
MRAKEFIIKEAFISTSKGFAPHDIGYNPDEDEGYGTRHLQTMANDIRRDCAPYIQANKATLKQGINLWRGVKGADRLNDFVIVGNVRTDRSPRDTNSYWHHLMDQFFMNEFGYAYRSGSMFAYTDPGNTTDYGIPFAVFPIGDYDICYSPKITDLTVDFASGTANNYCITSMLRNMTFDDIANLAQRYDMQWKTHDDIKISIEQYSYAIGRGVFRAGPTRETTGFDNPMTNFMLDYVIPRLDYTETYSIADIGDSEAMVKCQKYYGVLGPSTYRTGDKTIEKLMGMVLS